MLETLETIQLLAGTQNSRNKDMNFMLLYICYSKQALSIIIAERLHEREATNPKSNLAQRVYVCVCLAMCACADSSPCA